jgi:hypothetical protein
MWVDDRGGSSRYLPKVLRGSGASGYRRAALKRACAGNTVASASLSGNTLWPARRPWPKWLDWLKHESLILPLHSMNSWMSSISTIPIRRPNNGVSIQSRTSSATPLSMHGLELLANTSRSAGVFGGRHGRSGRSTSHWRPPSFYLNRLPSEECSSSRVPRPSARGSYLHAPSHLPGPAFPRGSLAHRPR